MRYKCVQQFDSSDCASACLASIAWYYGKKISEGQLREKLHINNTGTSVYNICKISQEIGLNATAYRADSQFDENVLPLPCILHVYQEDGLGHYIVLYKVGKKEVVLADPALGLIRQNKEEFFNPKEKNDKLYSWSGVIIAVEPSVNFKAERANRGPTANLNIKGLLLEQRRAVLIMLLLSFVSMGISVVSSFYFGFLIDKIIPYELVYTLFFLTTIVIALQLIKIAFDWNRAKVSLKLSQTLNIKMCSKYYKHMLSLQMYLIENRKNGDFISRFQDIERIQQALIEGILKIPMDVLFLVVSSILMFIINPVMSLLVFIMGIIYSVVMIAFRNEYSILNAQEMAREARVFTHLVDSIEGIRTIKAFNYENKIYDAGLNKIRSWQHTILSLGILENYQSALKVLIGTIGEISIICLGTWQIMAGNLSIGGLVTYNILIGYFISPLKSIINLQPLYHSAQIAAERLESILALTIESVESKENVVFNDQISINNVSFNYTDNRKVLDSVNMTIRRGSKIAIMGDTGSGKTTLAKLLVKMYPTIHGNIEIDGRDIGHIDTKKLRKKIIYVSQEDFLFSDSIRENLTMDNQSISDNEFSQICSSLGIDDFVTVFTLGYESIAEERGQNFSKGQRQKISIGRALIQKPDILILDEATSNIDLKSEQQILNYICSINNLTVIVISHHLSYPQKYDSIFIMKNGSIIEKGTHAELLKKSKIYQLNNEWKGDI